MGLAFWKKPRAEHRSSIYLGTDYLMLASGDAVYEQKVANPEQWQQAFAKLSGEAGLDNKHELVFVLSTRLVQIYQVDKPQVPDEELAGAVPWTVKDMVSEPISEFSIDFFQTPSAPMAAEKINVVCCRKATIAQLVAMAESCESQIAGITIEPLAAVSLIEKSERSQLLLWHPKGGELELLVLREGKACFARQLRAFSSLSSMQEIEFNQAYFDSLSLEMQRSIDYVSATLKMPEVSQILLALPSRFNDSIAEYLQANLGAKVEVYLPPGYDQPDDLDKLPLLGGLQPGVL